MANRFAVEAIAGEFDLPLCVNSGQVFRWEDLPDGSCLGVEGEHWYHASPSPAPGSSWSIASNGTQEDFTRLFRLDWDTADIERKILERGPEMAPCMDALRGLRVMRLTDPYETLFCFMCSANNHIRRISGMVRRLAEYGNPMGELEGRTLYRFPPPEVIASIPEPELRSKGFGYRAATIPRAARAILNKPYGWLPSLKDASYKAAHGELLTIPGIGPKLADCICLFGLHHMEAVPIDTHIWQAAVRLYFPDWAGKPLTPSHYREFGDFFRERFGELAGWAHQYLFYENVLNWRSRRKGKG